MNEKTVFLFLLLLPVFVNAGAPWANASYNYRFNCTMNPQTTAALTNFPGWCSLNMSNATLFNATTHCLNFRVYDNASNLMLYDVANVNGSFCGASATTNATVFIMANFTTGDFNQSFAYIYVGNLGASNGEQSQALWTAAGAVSAWHLGNATDEMGVNDLTGSGTYQYIIDSTKCKFGSCVNLSTAAYLFKSGATYPTAAAPSTMSCWSWRSLFKGDAYANALMAFGTSYRYLRSISTAGSASTNLRYTDENVAGPVITGAIQNNSWVEYYAAVSNSSNSLAIFKNTTTAQSTNSFGNTAAGGSITIGTETENIANRQWFHISSENGTISECRLYSINKSVDWLRAEYNMSSATSAIEIMPLNITYGTATQNTSCYVDSPCNFSVTVTATGAGTALCNWTSAPAGYFNHSVMNVSNITVITANDTFSIAWNCTDSQFPYLIQYNMSAPQQTNFTLLANGSMESNVSQDSSVTYLNVYWFNTTKGLPGNYNASANANPILTLNPGGNHTITAVKVIGLPLFGAPYADLDEEAVLVPLLLAMAFFYIATTTEQPLFFIMCGILGSALLMMAMFIIYAIADYSATVGIASISLLLFAPSVLCSLVFIVPFIKHIISPREMREE